MPRRAVATELELGPHVGDAQSQAPNRGEQLPVAVVAWLDRGVQALGLEASQLAFEDRRELMRFFDRQDIAGELDGGVVAGGHTVLVLVPVTRDIGVRAEDRQDRARPLAD